MKFYEEKRQAQLKCILAADSELVYAVAATLTGQKILKFDPTIGFYDVEALCLSLQDAKGVQSTYMRPIYCNIRKKDIGEESSCIERFFKWLSIQARGKVQEN